MIPSRIIAIGDIHGYSAALAALVTAIDAVGTRSGTPTETGTIESVTILEED